MRERRTGRLVMIALLGLSAACTSTGGPSGGGGRLPPAARELVAVWITDVNATVNRAAEAWKAANEKPAPATELERLNEELGRVDTQLGLNDDGTFILVNRARDAGGTITVEGRWEFADGAVRLTGLRVDGQPATPPRVVLYRVDGERLVRDGSTPKDACPVLKKGLLP
jgi:hypothetical protein